MSHSRNMKYLLDNRILYRQYPIKDQPTEEYEWGSFYEDGTHEYYNLFNSPAKINSYKSLKWHIIVLWYLNQTLSVNKFTSLINYIGKKQNGFVTFNADPVVLDKLVQEIYGFEFDLAPKNRIKKVIFRDNTGLTKSEKLSIVGKLLGRSSKATPEAIYNCMLEMNDLGEKITIAKLAKHLKCTTRTIHRNLTDELRKEKDILNEEVQHSKLRTS